MSATASEGDGPHCLACGTKILGPWCHACGQKNDDCRRAITRLAAETMSDAASLDGRFLRTFRSAITKPGRHVHEYAHGKRSPFTPPIRFFFVVITLFFFSLWIMDRNIFVLQLIPEDQTDGKTVGFSVAADLEIDGAELVAGSPDAGTEEGEVPPPKLVPYGGFLQSAQDLTYTQEERDWLESQVSLEENFTFLGREVTQDRLSVAFIQLMQNPAAFSNALNEAIPFLMLIFVPFMAFLGTIFIRGGDALVYDHLLVSIQTHAFAFVILTLMLWTSPFLPGGLGFLAFAAGIPIYYVLALRGAFRRSWLKSIAATLFVGWVYNFFFTLALTGAVLVSLWQIA